MASARGQLLSMLKVGLVGFGGGSALIPLVQDELVSRRKVLDPPTFTRQTIVASITPGALPVKLGALAGLHTGGAPLALAMALAVALPGTLLTIGLLASVSSGGEAAVRYVELASVGITVFIIALLVHYISRVLLDAAPSRSTASVVAVVAWLATGIPQTVQLLGRMVGREWDSLVPRLSAVQLVLAALGVIAGRALVRREAGLAPTHPAGSDERTGSHVHRAAALLLSPAVIAAVMAGVLLGRPALELLGLVALSSLTSFGGGEAYVGVADGFFVAGGHVDASVFYNQLVPVANALPGPILVKLAAGIGYASGSASGGPAMGWLLGGAAALVAIGSCTALAVLVMGAYSRAERSPVVRDIGAYMLPVICGLLVTTSVSMLLEASQVAARSGQDPAPVVWVSLAAVAGVTALRHFRALPDLVLLVACGAVSTAALAWL